MTIQAWSVRYGSEMQHVEKMFNLQERDQPSLARSRE